MRIELVGPFSTAVDGALVRLPARKTEALLAVLALRPGVAFGREWLAALLWPNVPEAQARTSLRQAVGHLRKALSNALVVSSAERVHLDPSAAWFDTAELERVCARPPSEREPLLELWRGPLLDGFAASEEPFDNWLSDERARLSERVAARLEECLAAVSAKGDLSRALRVGARLLDVEPTRETLARIHVYRSEFELGERHLQRALTLNPNDADMLMHAALALTQLGEPSRASELADDALGLNAKQPDWYHPIAAFARLFARQPDQALALALRAPDALVDTRTLLAVASAELGQMDAAREHARCFVANFRRKILSGREPVRGEPARWLVRVNPFRRSSDSAYLIEGLVRAGLEAP